MRAVSQGRGGGEGGWGGEGWVGGGGGVRWVGARGWDVWGGGYSGYRGEWLKRLGRLRWVGEGTGGHEEVAVEVEVAREHLPPPP